MMIWIISLSYQNPKIHNCHLGTRPISFSFSGHICNLQTPLLQLCSRISLKTYFKCSIPNGLIVAEWARAPILLVHAMPCICSILFMWWSRGDHAHMLKGGWPSEGRERVSTHVILVNEFRGFFLLFLINISVVIAARSCVSFHSSLCS